MDKSRAVVDYDPAWPGWFDEIREYIEPALTGHTIGIEHVGSTSVPGLAAKPVIDLDVVVASRDDVAAAICALQPLGYVHLGDLGRRDREAFRSPGHLPRHNLYVVVKDSRPYLDHVHFRDHLRRHPEDAARYAARKREVAHLYTVDPDAYVEAKSGVVAEILARARR
ncbi:GrpB family protein [Actinopolymorpha sp. B9G3]|uniref:GrpB family protein n=1 Tax=Actinopolymorpha sp. B9G3 TaxID=3158970 RepID=UPI0032D9201A